jgi:hypothetical protein
LDGAGRLIGCERRKGQLCIVPVAPPVATPATARQPSYDS